MAEQVDAREHVRRKAADAFTFGKLVDSWEMDNLRTRSVSYRKEATRALRSSVIRFFCCSRMAVSPRAWRSPDW